MTFHVADFRRSGPQPAAVVAPGRHFIIRVRGETIGLPVECVKTVFYVDNLTPMPLAPREVAGLTNLRGRIVTVLHLDRCLWRDEVSVNSNRLAVGIERDGEEYALLVDDTEDVVVMNGSDLIACPAYIDPRLTEILAGCYRLDEGFLSVLDIEALLRRVLALNEAPTRDKRKTTSNSNNRGARL